jgi:hypothetical protein
MLSAYFHKLSIIAYKNKLKLLRKQFDFILSFGIELAYP